MKPFWKSKTLIFNLLLILGGMYAPALSDAVRSIMIVNGLIGLGLRSATSTAVTVKAK